MTIQRTLIAAAALAVAAAGLPTTVSAEWKPTQPITVTIGFGPGGSTDTMGRLIAKHIEDNHVRALLGKDHRDPLADALRATGHQRYLILQ